MITLTTVGKTQGVSIYVIFIAFRASFVILTKEYFRFLQNNILISVLLWPKGYKELNLANIGCTQISPIIERQGWGQCTLYLSTFLKY